MQLNTKQNSNKFVNLYLNNAATSFPKPRCVIEAMREFLLSNELSPARGSSKTVEDVEDLIYQTRCLLSDLLGNFTTPERVILTKNATEGLN